MRLLPCRPSLRHRRRFFRPVVEQLERRDVPSQFEVWTIDQSNTRDQNGDGALDSGGTLYIYRGSELQEQNATAATPEVIDLGGAIADATVAATGSVLVRPHMMMFNSTHSHAIIACVASGHVLFMDTATRSLVGVIDVGVQAHAAFPAADDSYVIVADQNGKKLHRIRTDYTTNTFTLDATLDLVAGTTPSGAPKQDAVLRPDNAPICPMIESTSRFTFVTLRGGGLFVVDTRSSTMGIVGEYDRATVHRDGCGGIEHNAKIYINSGGAGEADLYMFKIADFDAIPNPPNTPAPTLIYSQDGGQVDSHGVTLTKHGNYLWVGDRWGNKVVVVDTASDTVAGEFSLAGNVSADPAPDLMDVSPSGNRVFIAFRGPNPLTGNNPAAGNAIGATPGVGIVRVEQGGRTGVLQALAPISHVIGGVERADPHALRVRLIRKGAGHGKGAAHDDDNAHASASVGTVPLAAVELAAIADWAMAQVDTATTQIPIAVPLDVSVRFDSVDAAFALPLSAEESSAAAWTLPPQIAAERHDSDLERAASQEGGYQNHLVPTSSNGNRYGGLSCG